MKPPHPPHQVQFQPGVFPAHRHQDLFMQEKITEKQIDKGQKKNDRRVDRPLLRGDWHIDCCN